MSYGNYGKQGDHPKRGGSGTMFLIILLFAGFFIMNFLRQQGSVNPDGSHLPDRSSQQGDYYPGDASERPAQIQKRSDKESKGGIYGAGQAERPPRHPDSEDWEMEVAKIEPVTGSSKQPISKRTDKGDWSIEEVPADEKQEQQFNLSESADKSKPKSKSTRKGDWELEEVDKK